MSDVANMVISVKRIVVELGSSQLLFQTSQGFPLARSVEPG